MVDLRAALRPLVDEPAEAPLPVAELAARAQRRRRRRRLTTGTGVAAAVLAVVAVAATMRPDDPSDQVSVISPPASVTTLPPTSTTTAAAPRTTTTSPPPATTTAATATAGEVVPLVDGIVAEATTTSEWDNGRCVEVRLDNTTPSPVAWKVAYGLDGTIATMWNATVDHQDAAEVVLTGTDFNTQLDAGAWTTFGLCIDT